MAVTTPQEYLRGAHDKRDLIDPARAREQRILVAGALNDLAVLEELGSMERMTWHDGRYLATNGAARNPYRQDRQ